MNESLELYLDRKVNMSSREKSWIALSLLAVAGLGLAAAPVEAQYRPPPAPKEEAKEEETFEAVDLKRFRKGRIDWDTQELIASGLTALHQEHREILKGLEELRTQLGQLAQAFSELKAGGQPKPEAKP